MERHTFKKAKLFFLTSLFVNILNIINMISYLGYFNHGFRIKIFVYKIDLNFLEYSIGYVIFVILF